MKKMNEQYRPDPHDLGDVVGETFFADGKHKSVIVQNKEGDFAVCSYELQTPGFSVRSRHSPAWVLSLGPTMVDTFEHAQKIAEDELFQLEHNKPAYF